MKKYIIKNLVLFIVGFCAYITIEVCYRGWSNCLMGITGALAFITIDKINDCISWDVDILLQSTIGSLLITGMELFIGTLSLNGMLPIMWDYSSVPLNYNGIICLPFSLIWIVLSFLAILLSDAINYYVFEDSDLPYYKLFGKVILKFKKKHCNINKNKEE